MKSCNLLMDLESIMLSEMFRFEGGTNTFSNKQQLVTFAIPKTTLKKLLKGKSK